METKDIQIGKCDDIKVGKNLSAVRIMKPAVNGGWESVTLATNKTVVIKSADRIVGPHNPKTDKQAQPAPAAPAKTDKPLSALEAALKVLAESGSPMNCPQMIEAMMAKGYWKPGAGKTPANTLHAAIGSEIKKKGDEARFEKVGRGLFGLAQK